MESERIIIINGPDGVKAVPEPDRLRRLDYEPIELSTEIEEMLENRHLKAVMQYSILLGEEIGLSRFELEELGLAAFLHDIGKVRVDTQVLNKPGPLTQQEQDTVRTHTNLAQDVLRGLPISATVSKAIKHHHERHDGSGYPGRLAGEDIPLESMIIAVADAFDVMTSGERVYRSKLTIGQALIELKNNSGTYFCPKVVDKFINAVSRIMPQVLPLNSQVS